MDHSPMTGAQPDMLLDDPHYDIASFKFRESDSAIVLTHSERDADVLQTLSGFKLRYVGLLGDRQRIRDDTGALRARGVDEKFVSSIKGPVGADIGARTMPEIALEHHGRGRGDQVRETGDPEGPEAGRRSAAG